MIFLDFETRSSVDLPKQGLHIYASHPSTEILCACYAFDDGPVQLWKKGDFEPYDLFFEIAERQSICIAEQQMRMVVEKGTAAELGLSPPPTLVAHNAPLPTIVAHNAPFELAIWNGVGVKKYGWPRIEVSDFLCTMAMAYAMALPGSLEKASAAVGIEGGKDMAGHRVMMQLSQPKDEIDGKIVWYDDAAKFQRLYEYCAKDVETERELYKRLVHLSPEERKVWLLDHEINNRGVQIDLKSVAAAIALVKAEKIRLDAEIRIVTSNQVATCTATAQLKAWLKSMGVECDGVAKADVLALLESAIPDACKAALLLRQEAAKTSTAKLEAMVKGAGSDGRVRGLTQYHGASTGRFSGRRLQVQNFPRPMISQQDIEHVFEILERGC